MSHKTLSWVKSAIRIVGYLMLPVNVGLAMIVLVLSEIIGVVEEVGE